MANIQTDSEGNQSSGTLNFTTDTLTTKDIINTATNDQLNLGSSIGVGTGKQGQSINNVGLQVGHTAHEFESVTKATVGEGAIVTSDTSTGQDSLAGVNRDPFNTEIIIKDQQTAGLGVDANIDARVFTGAGRTQIADEQKDIGENTKTVGKITASSGLQAVATAGSFVQGKQSISQAINSAKVPARMAAVIANNPNVGAVIQAYKEGDYDGLLKSQEAIQVLVDSTGLSTDVIITTLTQKLQAKGATNSEIIAIDSALENRADVIKVVGHEVSHDYSVEDEWLADLAGIAADLNVSASMAANQDNIDKYRVHLDDGKDAVTQAENKGLLDANDERLAKAIEKDSGSIDYKTSLAQDVIHISRYWNRETLAEYQEIDERQAQFYAQGGVDAIKEYKESMVNAPQDMIDLVEAFRLDPIGTAISVGKAVAAMPKEYFELVDEIAFVNQFGNSDEDFYKLGKAEITVSMDIVSGFVSAGIALVVKKVGTKVVGIDLDFSNKRKNNNTDDNQLNTNKNKKQNDKGVGNKDLKPATEY
ncbi:hypothetical protein [Psychrobacter phenylpyruvicus]|uniref:Uncharacterized protein n=2 Tax=Psychrobacter phenylpyruvicus TaxID=29432 RepID=A0A379LJ21_9GAMM|nr:hypothetical protein [Psychrobacter phenylpyruvicus]SUD90610.1 Uncharacterised protein [Psychrobacter phenylpyruvicus]